MKSKQGKEVSGTEIQAMALVYLVERLNEDVDMKVEIMERCGLDFENDNHINLVAAALSLLERQVKASLRKARGGK